MSNFAYKCVPVPDVVQTGKKGKDLHSQAVSSYERIINDAAAGGWELVNRPTMSLKISTEIRIISGTTM